MAIVRDLSELGFSRFKDFSWREYQAELVSSVLETDKKFLVAQAPTGFGKSPDAMASIQLTNEASGNPKAQGAIMTATKQLQSQYITDFPEAREMKGRANFRCTEEPVSAAEAYCTVHGAKGLDCVALCPYYAQKKAAERHPRVILNYAMGLNAMNYTGSFNKLELLVLDEGHLLDDMLMSFVQCSVLASTCAAFDVRIPTKGTGFKDWKSWASVYVSDMQEQLDALLNKTEGNMQARRKYHAGKALHRSMEFLVSSEEPWVCVPSNDGFDFMPVWIGPYAERYLYRYAKKVLILSATVLDPNIFAKVAGIPPEDMEFVDIPSTFPVGARPIYYKPSMDVKGGKQARGFYQPLLNDVYDDIRHHKGEKGLIHAVSYNIAQEVIQNAPEDVRKRLVTHSTQDRLIVYERFRQRTDNAVLVSPSMKEGVSLEDDQCRFIVVCKMPFPYLGSPQIEARMKSSMGQGWYNWKTFCDFMQMTGRGMRSKTDSCVVYVHDGLFKKVFKAVEKYVPQYWKDDLSYV